MRSSIVLQSATLWEEETLVQFSPQLEGLLFAHSDLFT
jgi:hypothetical protein